MVMKKGDLSDILKTNIGKFKDYVALATVNPDNYQETNIEIIRYLVQEEKIPGLYVTLNKPFNIIFNLLKKEKIKSSFIPLK